MKRLSLLIYVLIMFCITLTGCMTDAKEIDDQVYILAIGADRGKENKIKLTVQFPTYKGGAGGGAMKSGGGGEGGGKEEGVVGSTVVESVEAPSLLEGINLLNTFTSRKISLVHLKMVVFSEDFAREGIERYIEPLARFRETRRTMQFVVCRGTAEEFIMQNKRKCKYQKIRYDG